MLESYNFKLEKWGAPFLASSVPNVSLDDLAINDSIFELYPIVELDSKLNSFLVNLESKLDFPTPESPIKTSLNR